MINKKIALVTGANRGIGFETAKQLGEQNVIVVLAARKLADAEQAAAKLKLLGIDAHGIQLDITRESERLAAAQTIEDLFGKLDILINNAGVAPKDMLKKSVNIQTTPEDFDWVFKTNFFGAVHLTSALLPLLKKSDSGRIVNLSSGVGSLSIQSMADSPLAAFRTLSYNASKASLNMFTILLAEELKEFGIKVNSAHPGWVKTEMGSADAQLEIAEGAKTSVELALIDDEGPSGKFYHLGEVISW
ncbi:SDR family oxidoreductase [Dyadobacter subterraneus]|uniref:SDR family oxidoreductase n=1 Tax=Dyadobacter subterraneus TaxID=2773304 RepID=A0ABR9W8X9_9BACT|nr:SDR family oxidoreductase [Dyadobacter subterraneus]MBE9461920.1 SDR family oxidoreductase [Dyadobacter subterraneus]